MDRAALDALVADLDELVRGDGARFELAGWDDATGIVRLSLLVEDAACADCVVPRAMLESIASSRARTRVPAVAAVSIDDPRER